MDMFNQIDPRVFNGYQDYLKSRYEAPGLEEKLLAENARLKWTINQLKDELEQARGAAERSVVRAIRAEFKLGLIEREGF